MKYLIQTRPEEKFKTLSTLPYGISSWINGVAEFKTEQDAIDAAILLIQKGEHKSEDIRVVKVAITFSSTTTVNTQRVDD